MSMNDQVHEYLRSLEEKNRLKKLEAEKGLSAEEKRKKKLEKGFVTHFSGANEERRKSLGDVRERKKRDKRKKKIIDENVRAVGNSRRHSTSSLSQPTSRTRKTWGKTVNPLVDYAKEELETKKNLDPTRTETQDDAYEEDFESVSSIDQATMEQGDEGANREVEDTSLLHLKAHFRRSSFEDLEAGMGVQQMPETEEQKGQEDNEKTNLSEAHEGDDKKSRRERRGSRRLREVASAKQSIAHLHVELAKLNLSKSNPTLLDLPSPTSAHSVSKASSTDSEQQQQKVMTSREVLSKPACSMPHWLKPDPITTRRSPIYAKKQVSRQEEQQTKSNLLERPVHSEPGFHSPQKTNTYSPSGEDESLTLPSLSLASNSDDGIPSTFSVDLSPFMDNEPAVYYHGPSRYLQQRLRQQKPHSSPSLPVLPAAYYSNQVSLEFDNAEQTPPEYESASGAEFEPTYEYDANQTPQQKGPRGRHLRLNLVDTWGDIYYMGLTGLALLVRSHDGSLVEYYPDLAQVRANPSDINVNGHSGDPRTLDKLVDGTNHTCSEHHTWLIEFNPREDHTIEIDLGSDDFELAGIRVWNYNKNVEDTRRGVKVAHVWLDDIQLSPPSGLLFRRAPGTDEVEFGQTILFQAASSLEPQQNHVEEKFRWCGGHGFKEIARPISIPSGFFKPAVEQDWEAPLYPCGHTLRFDLIGTHGDASYIGLDKIELYDGAGQLIEIDNDSRGRVFVRGKSPGTCRLEPNLIAGRSWLERVQTSNRIYITFDEPIVLSMVKIWNYSKSPNRGTKEVAMYMDNLIIFFGELAASSRRTQQQQQEQQQNEGQTILFCCDEELIRNASVSYCGKKEQSVTFINNRTVVG